MDSYRAVKETLADLYVRYDLKPVGGCGLNVCVDKDTWNWAADGGDRRCGEWRKIFSDIFKILLTSRLVYANLYMG